MLFKEVILYHIFNLYKCQLVNNKYVIFKSINTYYVYYNHDNLNFCKDKYYFIKGVTKSNIYSKHFFNNKYSYTFLKINYSKLFSSKLLNIVPSLKQWIYNKINNSFVASLILNDYQKNAIDNKLTYLNASYIFCISAIHMMLITKFYNRFITNNLFCWLFYLLLIIYWFILGESIPYLKFLILFFLAKYNNKKTNSLNDLYQSAIVILLFFYNDFFSIGFTISFIYSFYIIFLNNFTNPIKSKLINILSFYALIILLSIITSFWLNGYITLWLPITNIIFTFLIQIIFISSWITLIISYAKVITIFLVNFFLKIENLFLLHNFLLNIKINILWALSLYFFLFLIMKILFFKYKYMNYNFFAKNINYLLVK